MHKGVVLRDDMAQDLPRGRASLVSLMSAFHVAWTMRENFI
jgi:hypothetical protein